MEIFALIKFYFFSEVFYKKFNRDDSLKCFSKFVLIIVSILIRTSTWLSPFILNLITYFNDNSVSYIIVNSIIIVVIWIMMSLLDRLTYSENTNKIRELEKKLEKFQTDQAQYNVQNDQVLSEHSNDIKQTKEFIAGHSNDIKQTKYQNQRSYFSSGDAYRAYFVDNLRDSYESSA
jgi:ABC-type multidrug transport system fused ATPase/permease subunit